MRPAINAHLNYYLEHRINLVWYDTSNLQLHLDRRASLYRTLGVTPLAVRGGEFWRSRRVQDRMHCTSLGSLPEFDARRAKPDRDSRHRHAHATPGVVPAPPLVIEARFEEYEPDGSSMLSSARTGLGVRITSGDYLRSSVEWSRKEDSCSSQPSRPSGCCRTCSSGFGAQARQPGESIYRVHGGLESAFGPHLHSQL